MSTRILTALLLLTTLACFCAEAWGQGPLRKRFASRSISDSSPRSARSEGYVPGGWLAEGTKKTFAGAREKMTFWKQKESRESNRFIEGTGRFFRPDLAERENENQRKPFSFVRPASWFEDEPEPEPAPQSVHDWIGQPRPGFE